MICPNCKTELVEVNGRYICSGCGREVPENEVMASNWGDGNTRAGLYGAGDETPEEGSRPITDYDSSLTETENELEPQVTTPVTPVATETLEVNDEPTVEEVLQSQKPIKEPDASKTVSDTGFYTAEPPATSPSSPTSQIEISSVDRGSTPEGQDSLLQGNDNGNIEIPQQVQDDKIVIPEAAPAAETVEPIPVAPIQETSNAVPEEPVIPAPIPSSSTNENELNSVDRGSVPEGQDSFLQGNDKVNTEILKQTQDNSEVVTEHTDVVKDMFENTDVASAPVHDPGIYNDPSYEISQVETPLENVGVRANMPTDKRNNLIITVVGSVLALILIVVGLLAYLYLEGVL